MGKASRLFNGDIEENLHERITPNEEQVEFLRFQWNELADYLVDELKRYGYPVSTWIQGSYKFNTLIKPLLKNQTYDVDLGVYFSESSKQANNFFPRTLRDWVQDCLLSYESQCEEAVKIETPPKERCSRISFKNHFHIDTPVYYLREASNSRHLACYSNIWEGSDPKLIYIWFKEAVREEHRGQLRRLIRYLKAWSIVAFEATPNSRITSISLTVVVTQEYKNSLRLDIQEMSDDDALMLIIEMLYVRLHDSSEIINPVDSSENLNRIGQKDWLVFLDKFEILRESALAARDSLDESAAALAWERAFSFLMPLPEAGEIEIVDSSSGRALMRVPDVEIKVYSKKGGQLIGTFINELKNVPKGSWLVFKLLQTHLLPNYSSISWTVRNKGIEAGTVGDLGHSKKENSLFTVEEGTAYSGNHFMDCLIRSNGDVYALRRIPVEVVSQRKIAAATNKAWMKLRSRIGRRRH